MAKPKLYLPFLRAVIAICEYTNDEEKRLKLLHEFNLPKDPKVFEILAPFISEIGEEKKYNSFIEYIKTLKSSNPALNNAIEYNSNPFVSLALKASILMNTDPKEIIGFSINNDILQQFKHYFFDISKLDIMSWQTYLDLLPKFDQDILRNAQSQNKDLVLVSFGKLPKDMKLIVNDLVITAFRKFKESIEDKPHLARMWARIATDALINQGDKTLDLDSKPFELIFENYEISSNPEEKPKVVGKVPMTPTEQDKPEEKDPDEIKVN